MSAFQDLTGMTFGKLTAIKRVGTQNGHSTWLCRCTCGNEIIVIACHLKSGHTTSCGCGNIEKIKQAQTTHGMSSTKIYSTWCHIISRCENSNNEKYPIYGGRGIKVCERWHDFQNFYDDVSKMENFNRAGYTLDRENNDKDYCPENCRWADAKTQNRNTRKNIFVEYEGVQMCLKDAAEKAGITYETLWQRYRRGDRGERLFRPVGK